MDSERLSSFIRSLEPPKSPVLEEIREEAVREGVPVIRTETGALLLFFVNLLRPSRILEIGCGTGYSASLMLSEAPRGAMLETIENYPPRIDKARENFIKAGVSERVTLYTADAAEVLSGLTGPYDLIFLDAAKAQYIVWLPEILRLLSPNGVLIADNVLQEGDILESRYAVRRRDRTIHKRMREFLYAVKHEPSLSTAVLPLGDGVTVSVKKKPET